MLTSSTPKSFLGIGARAVLPGGNCVGWHSCARHPASVAFGLPPFARYSFLRWTMSGHLDDWLRELSRAGLSTTEQQALLQRLSQTIDRRARFFPDSPLAFVERVNELLLSAFLP